MRLKFFKCQINMRESIFILILSAFTTVCAQDNPKFAPAPDSELEYAGIQQELKNKIDELQERYEDNTWDE